MQKEALVVSDTGLAWRLVSDEGPYLAGHDRAPCPLCHFVTGMVASYASQIMSLARSRDVGLGNIELTLDNFYTMEGSALQGTMTGGASTPRLSVETSADIPSSEILALVEDAVVASPVHGLLADSLVSRFTTSSQRECSAGGEGRADGDSAATRSW
jgi:hypothetical protein